MHGREEARPHAVAAGIRSGGERADIAIGDLSTDEGTARVLAQVLKGGDVDILVNITCAWHHHDWHTATPDTWSEAVGLNVIAGVRMIQRIIRGLVSLGWCRAIQIGGSLAEQPSDLLLHDHTLLTARHNLAASLARRLKCTGLTSNVVAQGAILVPAVKVVLDRMAPQQARRYSWKETERRCVVDMVPDDVRRLGRPEEIAGAVTYLRSALTDHVNGATIRVDRGTVKSAFWWSGCAI